MEIIQHRFQMWIFERVTFILDLFLHGEAAVLFPWLTFDALHGF